MRQLVTINSGPSLLASFELKIVVVVVCWRFRNTSVTTLLPIAFSARSQLVRSNAHHCCVVFTDTSASACFVPRIGRLLNVIVLSSHVVLPALKTPIGTLAFAPLLSAPCTRST